LNCVALGEAAYNEAREEAITLEDRIVVIGLEYADLDKEQNAICEQLKEMQKGGSMSFWPKPILHPDRPPCNGPTMIVIKSCGLCGQWYHCWDIVVTSCLHTYHPTCLSEHLKMNNRCKVCNQTLHPYWWSNWDFKDLDDDLTCMVQEMGLEEE
jgi:hypothetical protein